MSGRSCEQNKRNGIDILEKPLTDWTPAEKLAFAMTYNGLIGDFDKDRTLERYYRSEFENKIDRMDENYARLKQVSDNLLCYLHQEILKMRPDKN